MDSRNIYKVLLPAVLFVVSTLTLILQKSTFVYVVGIADHPDLPSSYRYITFSTLLLAPQLLSLIHLLWNVTLTTRSNHPVFPGIGKFARDCLVCVVESGCLAALMVTTFKSLPSCMFYPLTTMVLVSPVLSQTVKDILNKSGRSCFQYITDWLRFLALILCCVTPLVLGILLYVCNILGAFSAVSLAVSVPGIGFCWTNYLGRLSRCIVSTRYSRKIHAVYAFVRLVSVIACIGLFVYFDTPTETRKSSTTSLDYIKADLLGCAFVLILSSCAFVFFAFVSLSLCEVSFGVTFPSLVSTLVTASVTLVMDSERLYYGFEFGDPSATTNDVTGLYIIAGLTAISMFLVFLLYAIGHSHLPGKPRYLMAPFDHLFDDYFWSVHLLDLKLILSAYTRAQVAHTQRISDHYIPESASEKNLCIFNARKRGSSIFICATMYRENKIEMQTLITSFQHLAESSASMFSGTKLSLHIFFDDGCRDGNLTEYANQLLSCVHEVTENYTSKGKMYSCAYGLQYRQDLVNDVPLTLHFKDGQKYKNKKRWSQAMYMQYIINYYLKSSNVTDITSSEESIPEFKEYDEYATEESQLLVEPNGDLKVKGSLVLDIYAKEMIDSNHVPFSKDAPVLDFTPSKQFTSTDSLSSTSSREISPEKAENTYIMVVDGDTQFTPDTVLEMFTQCALDGRVGAVCGRIHPRGQKLSTAVWFQKFEYAQDFWMLKSSQNVFGTVTCCPGCCSLYRVSALQGLLPSICEPTLTPTHVYRKDTGEDRWITALIILQGWRLRYASCAQSHTYCPDSFSELLGQRKRWVLSDLANDLLLLQKIPTLLRTNETITLSYAVFYYLLFGVKVIFPSCLLFSIVLATSMMHQCDFSSGILAIVIGTGVYVIVSLMTSGITHARITMVFSVVLAGLFVLTIIDLAILAVGAMKDIGPTHASFYYSALLVCPLATSIYGALMHPREAGCLRYWPVYMLYVPTVSVLLPIFSICSIGDQSWGTRDGSMSKSFTCHLPDWGCVKGGYSQVAIDENSDSEEDVYTATQEKEPKEEVKQQQEKKAEPTSQFPEMSSEPELIDEANFWKELGNTLLGRDVNSGREGLEMCIALRRARLVVLGIWALCNGIVLSVQALIYCGLLSPVITFNTYVMLVVAIVFLISAVPVAGLTCYTLLTVIRRVAGDTFATPDQPLWTPSRNDAIIQDDLVY